MLWLKIQLVIQKKSVSNKQCTKQNHGKFLLSFTVSASSAVLMAVQMFHLYNIEAKGRSFRALHFPEKVS